jgi:hypothetical protein
MGNGKQRCHACGAIAPTRFVDFKQNVGMLVMRRSTNYCGEFCKPCVHKHFWKATGTTLAVGWLGRISMFVAPVYVVNNIVRYVAVLGMPGPGSVDKPGKGTTATAAPVAAVPYSPPKVSTRALPFDTDDEAPEPIELLPAVDPAELLKPYWASMVGRLKAKESLDSVSADVAAQTGLTADEVSDYIRDRVRRAKEAKAAAAGQVPAVDRV